MPVASFQRAATLLREPYAHETHYTIESFLSAGLRREAYRDLPPVAKKLILNAVEALNYFRGHPDRTIRKRYNGHVAHAFIKNQYLPVLGDPYLFKEHLKEFIREYKIDEEALKEQADLYFPMADLIVYPARDYSYKAPLKPRQLTWIRRIVSNDAYERIVSGAISDDYLLNRLRDAADFLTWLTERRGINSPGEYIKLMRQAIANTGMGPITGREQAIKASSFQTSSAQMGTGIDLKRFLNDTYRDMGISEGTVRAYVDLRDAGHAGPHAKKPVTQARP